MEYVMSVRKSGNSLIIRIPKEIKKLLNLNNGDVVKVKLIKMKR